MTTRPVRDFDFHPDEDHVRVSTCRPDGVLLLTDNVYASAARHGDIVLWHYAFARYWFSGRADALPSVPTCGSLAVGLHKPGRDRAAWAGV